MNSNHQTKIGKSPFQNLDTVSALKEISDGAAATYSGGYSWDEFKHDVGNGWNEFKHDVGIVSDNIAGGVKSFGKGGKDGSRNEKPRADDLWYNLGYAGGKFVSA